MKARSSFEHTSSLQENHVNKWRKTDHVTLEESSTVSANVVSVSTAGESLNGQNDESTTSGRIRNGNELSVQIRQISTLTDTSKSQIDGVKARLAADLKASGGDVETAGFLACLDILEAYYRSKSWDGRGSFEKSPFCLEGNWLTLSKPTYNEGKGRNERGEFMYSLGQMSVDMFKPTNLVGEFHTGPVACWISDQPWGQV
jgi:hypothetical protein